MKKLWPIVICALIILSACTPASSDTDSTTTSTAPDVTTTTGSQSDTTTTDSTSDVTTTVVTNATTKTTVNTTTTTAIKMPVYNGTTYSIVDEGAVPNSDADISGIVNTIISKMVEGDTLLFPQGTYHTTQTIDFSGKTGIRVLGENATLIQDNGSASYFYIRNCSNITIKGLTLDYKDPITVSGTVVSTNPDECYFILQPFDEFSWVTGTETYDFICSHDADGTPNGELAGNGVRAKKQDDGTLRVLYTTSSEIEKLEPGDGITMRRNGGSTAIPMVAASNILLEDLTIHQARSMVSNATERCSNITWRRVKVTPKAGSQQFMITYADNFWLSEMTGQLVIEDCLFECLGDDALNVHHTALWALAVNGDGTMQIARESATGSGYSNVNPTWIAAGDILSLYDPDTFLECAQIKAKSFDGSILQYELISGTPKVGCCVDNLAFYPSVRISNTTVTRTRSRGLTIQSRNVVVENCTFNRIGLGAILVAPDIAHWNELGPSANVTIRNNTFDKCARAVSYLNFGSIMVKCSHDSSEFGYPSGVHTNLTIENNVFDRSGGSAILVSSTDGVTLKNNHIKQYDAFPMLEPDAGSAIRLLNCTNVVQENNKTDHGVLIFQE